MVKQSCWIIITRQQDSYLIRIYKHYCFQIISLFRLKVVRWNVFNASQRINVFFERNLKDVSKNNRNGLLFFATYLVSCRRNNITFRNPRPRLRLLLISRDQISSDYSQHRNELFFISRFFNPSYIFMSLQNIPSFLFVLLPSASRFLLQIETY